MEVKFKLSVEQGDIAHVGGPVVVVNLYDGVKHPTGATAAVDAATGGVITRALASGDFKGSAGEAMVLYPTTSGRGVPERVVVLGMGKADSLDLEGIRRIGGTLSGVLRKLKVKRAATVLHGGESGKPAREVAQALIEGLLYGLYRYDNYFRDGRAEPLLLEQLTVVEKLASRVKALREGAALGLSIGNAVNEARELGNGPSNEVTPAYLAETAKRLGRQFGFKVKVLEKADCEKLGMGAFLGVARGATAPPKFIIMEHEPARPKGTVCLVGKAITFDTGGISLKPGEAMELMKFDMGGGAAVLGTMRFVAENKIPLKVIGIVPATFNMPDGDAYKPGDILTSMAGITIEVKNTDAEGRLILCDALAYAERFKPDAVIDLATLTGACVIALGSAASGVMANDEWILDELYKAAEASGDRAWPLPLWSDFRDMVKSDVADIKNTAGRAGGAITAGAFLGAFTNGYRWAHLDIAGTAWNEKPGPIMGLGGTGAGVRILAEFLTHWKKPAGQGPKPGPRTSLRSVPANNAAPKPSRKKRG
jgi:leucyl aminopeptidase